MKTGHAPDNLIPSAKPLSKELARQFLPDDLQEATLTKKQRKKQKKKTTETVGGSDMSGMAPASAESLLSSNLHRLNLAGSQGPAGSFNFKSGQLSRQSMPGGSTSTGSNVNNRVPLMDDGRVDLQRLSLPQGISISKISGPVPERKYFPSKPAPEVDPNSKLWPHQQPGFKPATPGNVAPPPAAAESGVDPMYANDPNVIVVDTNSLPTRSEEEQKKSKQSTNKKQKSKSPELVAPKPTAAAPGGLPMGGVEYTPGKPLPPAMAAGGSGQVLIKSVNGKVVITPVPDPVPQVVAAASQPQPATATAKTTVMNGSSDMTATMANGIKSKVIVNGGGEVTSTDGAGDGVEAGETTKKKKGKKKKNTDENLHDINSVFAPRDGLDLSENMDAADREIEQFKQFCLNTVMLQNRTKVNLDLKSIKKKE